MSVPLDALGTQALAEMYKDLKDNRNMPTTLIALLGAKIGSGEACNVDEFLKAAENAESVLIRFYRKLVKLLPGRFTKTDLLTVDMRQSSQLVRGALREFLLWNQGVQTFTTSAAAAAPSGAIVQQANGKLVYAAPTSGPMAKKVSTLAPSAPAPVPKPNLHTNGPTPVQHVMTAVKILPSQLWKNSSLPTRQDGVVGPASGSAPDSSPRPTPQTLSNGGSSGLKRSPVDGVTSSGGKKQHMATEREIIDLLLDDDFDEDAVSLSSSSVPTAIGRPIQTTNVQQSHLSAAPQQFNRTPTPTAPSPSLMNVKAATSAAIPQVASQPPAAIPQRASQPANAAPSVVQQRAQPSAANPPAPVQNQHEVWIQQTAAHYAKHFGVDVTFCVKALRECGTAIHQAQSQIQQYAVDLEEARLTDQIRLQSESTAANDKKRASMEREKRLSTGQAIREFPDSELSKHIPLIAAALSRDETALAAEGIQLRRCLVQFLEEEKKAIKWYRDAAKAYMRGVAKRFCSKTISHNDFFVEELKTLKECMYSTASESGTPMAFLAALDLEMARVAEPGQILGLSAEAPLELV